MPNKIRNSFCFTLKTHKERNKSSKRQPTKKRPQKTRSHKTKETDLNAILHNFYYSLQQKASNEFSGFWITRCVPGKKAKSINHVYFNISRGTLQALCTNKLYKDITSKFEQFLPFKSLWKAFETGNSNVCGNRQHMIAISLLLMEGVCCVCG